jgi:hypothetical protein
VSGVFKVPIAVAFGNLKEKIILKEDQNVLG